MTEYTDRKLISPGATAVTSGLTLLIGAVAAIGAIALPVNQLTQPGGSVTIADVNPDVLDAFDVPGLPAGTYVELDPGQGGLTYHASELSWPLRLLTEAPAAVGGLCTAVGAWLLWRILREIAAGRPFHPRNPARIAGIGVAVIAGVVVGNLLQNFATAEVLERTGAGGSASTFGAGLTIIDLPLMPVVLALVLFIVADVFRRGRQLTEDVEGLV